VRGAGKKREGDARGRVAARVHPRQSVDRGRYRGRRRPVARLPRREAVIRGLGLALALLTLAGCETTTSGGAVGADRSQLMLVSSSELDQMAVQGYAKLLADAAHAGPLNRVAAMLKRV